MAATDGTDAVITSDGENRCLLAWPTNATTDRFGKPIRFIDLVTPLTAYLESSTSEHPGGAPAVIVDMGGIDYLTSAGIGAIFSLRKHLASLGGMLVVCRPKPIIARMFKTVNLPELIPVANDLDAARKLLAQLADN